MAEKFKRFVKGIVLQPETSNPSDNIEGSMWHTQEELLGTITAIVDGGSGNANITVVGHGLKDNNKVVIANSDSTPLIDGTHTVTRIDADTFSIPSITITTPGTTGDFTRTQNRIRMYLAGEVREMITDDQVQTIINKALQDASSKIIDDLDETKEFQFQLAGQTTETKTTLATISTTDRTITLPDADDTLVGLETSDLLKNKSFEDSSTLIVDDGDNTKTLDFQLSGATTSTKTTLNLAQTTDRTLNFPDADDTLLGRNTTDTLTNKLFNQDILPLTDDNNSVGSQTFRYQNIYLDDTGGVRIFQDTSTEMGRVNGELSDLTILSVGTFELKLQSENQTTTTVSQAVTLQSGDTEDGNSANVTIKAGVPSGSGTRGDVIIDGNNIQFLADTGISGVANDTLSNLTSPTSLNQDLLPSASLTRDLGSASLKFAELHTTSITDDGTDLTLSTQNLSLTSTANLNLNADGDGTANDNLIEILSTANALYTGGILIGSGNATANDSGDVTLRIGSAGGTKGSVRFQDGSEGTIGHVWQSTGVNGEGAWEANPAAGANDTLSNLSSPTAINQNLIGAIANFTLKTQNNSDADANPTEDLLIKSGDKTAGTGDSGGLIFETGSSAGGNRGPISFKDGSEGTAGHVWVSQDINGLGTWQAFTEGVGTPGGTTDNAIVRWDGVGGDTLQNSIVEVDDSGQVIPTTTGTGGVGTNLNQFASGYIQSGFINTVEPISGTLTLGNSTGNETNLNAFSRIIVTLGSGNKWFYPAIDRDYEMGRPDGQVWKGVHAGNSIWYRATGVRVRVIETDTTQGTASVGGTFGVKFSAVSDDTTSSGAERNLIFQTVNQTDSTQTGDLSFETGNNSSSGDAGSVNFRPGTSTSGSDGIVNFETEEYIIRTRAADKVFNRTLLGAEVTTTDATETTLRTRTVGTDCVLLIRSKVIGRETSPNAGDAFGYIIESLVKDISGTLTLISSTTTTIGEDRAGADAIIDVDTNDFRVRVTGDTGTTITWRDYTEIMEYID